MVDYKGLTSLKAPRMDPEVQGGSRNAQSCGRIAEENIRFDHITPEVVLGKVPSLAAVVAIPKVYRPPRKMAVQNAPIGARRAVAETLRRARSPTR
jgi:hypothetical protein